ncbi:MAG: hypothetical protein ABS46_00945 [Cytophagaceae bacterium SCN 52-12]|nr:MAG: hypothetical protein ABS46_00945 [Cytophagaceae bacterium SCN 52-12]
MIKAALLIITVLLTWLLWLAVSQYLLCPRYQFEQSRPFEGSVIYNPYHAVDSGSWFKCNFHAHSQAWNRLTNGHGTAHDVHTAYRRLGYDFHCVSNYQQLDTTGAFSDLFIPVYEHGYNVRKTHQQVLGSRKVKWLDYLMPQTTHNKQRVLNALREPDNVVILNHPKVRNGYTPEDLRQLSGFDCMEVLNPAGISTEAWDAALSSGKKVFVVGNDDTHDVIRKIRLGVMCTFINAREKKGSRVLDALKAGQSVGVIIGVKQDPDSIPVLRNMEVSGDSIWVTMSHLPDSAEVTGQDGKALGFGLKENSLKFRLQKEDHYARSTFYFPGGTVLFLNPVFFMKDSGYEERSAVFNGADTFLYRSMGAAVLTLWVALLARLFIRQSPPRYGWKEAG